MFVKNSFYVFLYLKVSELQTLMTPRKNVVFFVFSTLIYFLSQSEINQDLKTFII